MNDANNTKTNIFGTLLSVLSIYIGALVIYHGAAYTITNRNTITRRMVNPVTGFNYMRLTVEFTLTPVNGGETITAKFRGEDGKLDVIMNGVCPVVTDESLDAVYGGR